MRKIVKQLGFTLIELLIVIVIIAILARIAAALYTSYALEGRRIDAINAITNVSLAEERYRSNNTTYGSLAQLSLSATSPQGYYTITVSNVTATAYTVTATGVGTQVNDKSGATACSPMVLTSSAGTVTQTPAGCWPS